MLGAPVDNKKDSEQDMDDLNASESFNNMKLSNKLLRGIYALRFEKPSRIQQLGIIPCIEDHDTIVQAQSVTGKIATFSLASQKEEAFTFDGIQQFFIIQEENWKVQTLEDLNMTLAMHQCVIFCNTTSKTKWVHERLSSLTFPVSCMHEEMETAERQKIMKEFRKGASKVLIATGSLAGEIAWQDVFLVINFDFPTSKEDYIKRIPTATVQYRKKVVVYFIEFQELRAMKEMENFYKIKIEEIETDINSFL